MGSCSSLQRKTKKNNTTNTDMKLKLSLFGSKKSENVAILPSPIKEQQQQPKNGIFRWSPTQSTTNFTNYGSKEDAFFDSKAWLDSDCEDDFYSVNGDFTPSRGSTPVHHNFATSGVNKTSSQNGTPGSISQTSPEKKKRLSELFSESIRDNQENGDERKEVKPTIQDVLPKSANSTPYISGPNSTCGSERAMSEDRASIREKLPKSSPWCIPSLSSCRSFSEKRRKASPAIAVNGKHSLVSLER